MTDVKNIKTWDLADCLSLRADLRHHSVTLPWDEFGVGIDGDNYKFTGPAVRVGLDGTLPLNQILFSEDSSPSTAYFPSLIGGFNYFSTLNAPTYQHHAWVDSTPVTSTDQNVLEQALTIEGSSSQTSLPFSGVSGALGFSTSNNHYGPTSLPYLSLAVEFTQARINNNVLENKGLTNNIPVLNDVEPAPATSFSSVGARIEAGTPALGLVVAAGSSTVRADDAREIKYTGKFFEFGVFGHFGTMLGKLNADKKVTKFEDKDEDSYGIGNSLEDFEGLLPPKFTADNNTDCDDTNIDLTTDCKIYYQDSDTDTFGNPGVSHKGPLDGYVLDDTDCDDSDATVATIDQCDARDSDGDGLTDVREATLGTLPNNKDSDGDGLSDGAEVLGGPKNGDRDSVIPNPVKYPVSAKDYILSDPLKNDTDGDGIYDTDEVEFGTNPNDKDTDKDGISDGVELTNKQYELDAHTASPVDTDNDQIIDALDLDSDGDNIGDIEESKKLGNNGSLIEKHEDLSTVPVPTKVIEAAKTHPAFRAGRVFVTDGEIVITEKILFDSGKDIIKRESFSILDEVVSVMKEHTNITKLEIQGHTDRQGPDAYNMTLSNKRATAVLNYFKTKGIEESRLTANGYGETMPFVATEDGVKNDSNRRVQFIIEAQIKEVKVYDIPGSTRPESNNLDIADFNIKISDFVIEKITQYANSNNIKNTSIDFDLEYKMNDANDTITIVTTTINYDDNGINKQITITNLENLIIAEMNGFKIHDGAASANYVGKISQVVSITNTR